METETSPNIQLDVQSIQESSSRSYSTHQSFLVFCRRWHQDSHYPCFLQVQRIKNEFTVTVYEIHARIALETVSRFITGTHLIWLSPQSDMVEYNQCQATLKTLYELGIRGHVEEFTAYRILMLLHGRNRSGRNHLLDRTFFLSDLNAYLQNWICT